MKKIYLMLILAISIISVSCTKDPIFGDHNGCKDPDPKQSCEAVIADEGPSDNVTTSAGTNVKNAWIEGNNLKLEIGYSGCNKHSFDMHWNKNQINIALYPNRTYLQLVDNNGEQFCQAYFQDTLCFDISKLKTGTHGEMLIKLQNHDEVGVTYKY
jgi:hypothetical protein